MRIENLRSEAKDNSLRFIAKISWEDSNRPAQEIYFETEKSIGVGPECDPHAFLVACIIPAMHHGERRVSIDAEIDPALEQGLYVVMNWFQNWFEPHRQIVRIEMKRPKRLHDSGKSGKAAVFLSGGVDSLATLRHNHLNFHVEHPWHIRDGVFIQGQNIESDTRLATFERAKKELSDVCSDAGVTFIPVVTNIRELEPDTTFFLKQFQSAILAAVAHALSGRVSVANISASESIPSTLTLQKIAHFQPYGSHPLIDINYSSSNLLIRHVLPELTRLDKTRLIAEWDAGLQNIKVCQPNWPGENCGRCEKCVRTMLALVALGVLNKTRAFSDNDLSETTVRNIRIEKQQTADSYSVEYDYLELIPHLRARGREDLVRAIEYVISVSRYRDPSSIRERVKGFDRRYLGGFLSRLKRFSVS